MVDHYPFPLRHIWADSLNLQKMSRGFRKKTKKIQEKITHFITHFYCFHIKNYFLCAFYFLYKQLYNAVRVIITPKKTIK